MIVPAGDAPLLATDRLGAFNPRRTPVLATDVLILGGGLAGAMAALTAAEHGAEILLLSKNSLAETNTAYAQGGIAAVLAPEDSLAQHIADTLQVGGGLAVREIVEHFVHGAAGAVERLEALGTVFDHEAGARRLGREGGHSVPRVVHADGTRTGAVMQAALLRALEAHPRITIREGTFARDVVVEDGRCVGCVVSTERGDLGVAAGSVVLATGGAGQIYRETTNPIGACADGIAMAYRAGALVADLEFVQFHPTTLYIAGASRYLISEVVRGAGAVLRDRTGASVMDGVHPLGDLAPRDIVSRAILQRMVDLGDTHVYLDLTAISAPKTRFAEVAKICEAFDIDIAHQSIPVRPGAHYMVGGVVADVAGRTSIPGLYAIGEAACTSFHGANRLASNSLLEAALMGEAAGRLAVIDAPTTAVASLPATEQPGNGGHSPRIHLDDMLYSLKSLMWRQVGLLRSGAGVLEAQARIDLWGRYLQRAGALTRQACELANMLTVASLISRAASERNESRGTHYRTDAPTRDDAEWCRQVMFTRSPSGPLLALGPVRVPSDLKGVGA